jgi:hypothetical protein
MEGLGVAANIIAVVDLSAKLVGWCAQYAIDVKNANNNKARLLREVTTLNYISKKAKDLLEGPQSARLQTSTELRLAIVDGESQLKWLEQKLSAGAVPQTTSRAGFRALKWPFQSKDVERTVQDLGRCIQAISLALQIDQMSVAVPPHL